MNFTPSHYITELRCLICNTSYKHSNIFTCPSCGAQGILDVQYDYEKINTQLKSQISNRPLNHWRYRELLPIAENISLPHLHVGWTPIYDVPRLAKEIGIQKLFLKDDGRNASSSFKDRASSIGVLKAVEFGFNKIACASTGNAASSLAGLSAAVGLQSFIFVPKHAPEPKVTQLLIFGATVFKVQGTYDDAFELCRASCEKFGWYNRNSGTNPFLVEGKKTAGLEIAEQMKENLPDWVVVSVGDGCTIGGIGKGLQEMKRLGFIERVPRLLGVQAEGARPIVDAFYSGNDLIPAQTKTLADSIDVGVPRNWRRTIQQIKLSNGEIITVEDEEILEAMRQTGKLTGVFGEPAGIACVAGLKNAIAKGMVKPNESAVCVITGNGLKDIRSAQQAVGKAIDVEPNINAVENSLRQ